MVASIDNEMLTQGLRSPAPEPSDSAHVRLALQSARAFEAKGDLNEAATWLRHAAEALGTEGNDARRAALLRAAANLTSVKGAEDRNAVPASSSTPPGRSVPPPLPPDAFRRKGASSGPARPALALAPPPLPARASSLPPPSPPRATSPGPTRTAPPPSVTAATPLPVRKASPVSARKDTPLRVAAPVVSPAPAASPATRTIRVSIKRSARDPGLLVVRRLDATQALPAGTSEALLVIGASDEDPFSGPVSDKKP
jgi:hypothetical protein